MSTEPNHEIISQNIEAGVSFALSKYGLGLATVTDAVLFAIRLAADARPALAMPMIRGLIHAVTEKRIVARRVIEELPMLMSEAGISVLVSMTGDRLLRLLEE
jgi:hypothetical protein